MNKYTILLFSIAALPVALYLLRLLRQGLPKIKFRRLWYFLADLLKSKKVNEPEQQQYKKRPRTRVTQKFMQNFEAVFGVNGSFSDHDKDNVRAKVYTELHDQIISSEADTYKKLWNQILMMIHPDRAANSPFTRDQLDTISQYYLDVFPKN